MSIIEAAIWFVEVFGWRRLLFAPPMLMLLVVLVFLEQVRREP